MTEVVYPVHVKGVASDEYVRDVVERARKKVGLDPKEIDRVIFVINKVINFVTKAPVAER